MTKITLPEPADSMATIVQLRAERDALQARIDQLESRTGPAHIVEYTNWRGVVSTRAIHPICFWWGSTPWHPEDQWMITAFDAEKQAVRDFAWQDMRPVPNPATSSAPKESAHAPPASASFLHLLRAQGADLSADGSDRGSPVPTAQEESGDQGSVQDQGCPQAEAPVLTGEPDCPDCGLPHPSTNPYCFCKSRRENNG